MPGGSVSGNNRVWRRFVFTPVSTSRLRVLGLGGASGYTRITEFEVYGTGGTSAAAVNHAAQAAGGVALASSVYSAPYAAAGVNNGDRRGIGWGSGSAGAGWNDATGGSWPDNVQVNFSASKSITEINVFTLQDAYAAPQEPTETMTFTQYGITAFEVQTWNGAAWVTVPGGSVTSNNQVWRKFTFPGITTSAVRVLVHAGVGGYSRITELEAWGPP